MSVFDVFNTGTITIVKCNATQDTEGGAVAGYFDEDGGVIAENVIEAGVAAQVDYHRDRNRGQQELIWGQDVDLARRDIWVNGTFSYLGDTGNGYGVIFEGTRFGRITAVERDQQFLGMDGSIMLLVQVVE